MAHADIVASALADRKTEQQLNAALDILLDETLASDHVLEQQLSEVGFTFQVRTQPDRDRCIALVTAALKIRLGQFSPSAGSGHFMNFATRRIE
jgi:NifU-like protein involved in Fe-S cluster formation